MSELQAPGHALAPIYTVAFNILSLPLWILWAIGLGLSAPMTIFGVWDCREAGCGAVFVFVLFAYMVVFPVGVALYTFQVKSLSAWANHAQAEQSRLLNGPPAITVLVALTPVLAGFHLAAAWVGMLVFPDNPPVDNIFGAYLEALRPTPSTVFLCIHIAIFVAYIKFQRHRDKAEVSHPPTE